MKKYFSLFILLVFVGAHTNMKGMNAQKMMKFELMNKTDSSMDVSRSKSGEQKICIPQGQSSTFLLESSMQAWAVIWIFSKLGVHKLKALSHDAVTLRDVRQHKTVRDIVSTAETVDDRLNMILEFKEDGKIICRSRPIE